MLVSATDTTFSNSCHPTVWPSGLRRWLQAPVRKGVGSNPTAVNSTGTAHGQFQSPRNIRNIGNRRNIKHIRNTRNMHAICVRVPCGYIAQWLERLTADQQVPGSNPGVPLNKHYLQYITIMCIWVVPRTHITFHSANFFWKPPAAAD